MNAGENELLLESVRTEGRKDGSWWPNRECSGRGGRGRRRRLRRAAIALAFSGARVTLSLPSSAYSFVLLAVLYVADAVCNIAHGPLCDIQRTPRLYIHRLLARRSVSVSPAFTPHHLPRPLLPPPIEEANMRQFQTGPRECAKAICRWPRLALPDELAFR